MVRAENLLITSSSCWSKSASRNFIVGWMMKNVNKDLHKAAEDMNAEYLLEIAEYGAWWECTMADDPERNTALHRLVINCMTDEHYHKEAGRLRLQYDKIEGEYTTKSRLRKFCESKFQVEQLKGEVSTLKGQTATESACLGALLLGGADPRYLNAAGQTAIDLAKDKRPEVLYQLEKHLEWLEMKEAAEEAEEEAPRPPGGRDSLTGLYVRDAIFGNKQRTMYEAIAKQNKAEERKKLEKLLHPDVEV